MKKTSGAFLVLFCFAASAAFAQGNFLKRGQSGFGLAGAYATNSQANGFSGTAGVSLGGAFDFSLGVGHATFPGAEIADLEATTFEPGLTVHVIKQNSSTSPVSLAFSIGYAHETYSSPDLDAADITMRTDSYMLGVTVYRDVPLGRRLYLQPVLTGGYRNDSFKVTIGGGQTGTAEDDVWSLRVGLPLVYGLSERALLVLDPGLATDKNNTTFTAALSLVYIFKTKV